MTRIEVEFGEHIKLERVEDMSATLMACGNVTKSSDRIYLIEVARPRSLTHLEETLLNWDRHGFVKWRRVEEF